MRQAQLDYEDVVEQIGQFGPWQRWIFFWMCLVSAASGLFVMTYIFTGYEPRYRCTVPFCENATTAIYGEKNGTNFTFQSYVMKAIPKAARDDSKLCQYYGIKEMAVSDAVPTSCDEYLKAIERNDPSLELTTCTHEKLIFDKSVVKSSAVTQYGFTCKSSYLKNIYGSSYMIGLLFGSFSLGIISDYYGRMKAIMIAIYLASISGFICAFLPGALEYGCFRFLTGIGGMGCFMISFVISVECVGAKYTTLVGVLIEIPFAIGELLLGLEAYFYREFFQLQLIAHSPLFLLMGLWFIVPESPRWLMAVGKFQKAKKIIKKAAKLNKTSFPTELFGQNGNDNSPTDENSTATIQKLTFVDMFRPRPILGRTLNMFFQWFSVTLCYYGLSFSSTSLTGDPYTNFALLIFIEIPGCLLCVILMDCWGRRPILSFTQILTGVACMVAGASQDLKNVEGLQLSMVLLGKFGASASFAIVYVYTAELYPTPIRNSAIGGCSLIARIGATFAPLIGLIGGSAQLLIMGMLGVFGGYLAMLFPETARLKLPQTMEEALNIGKNSPRGACTCECPQKIKDLFSKCRKSGPAPEKEGP